jgi:hypothetical protein
MEIQGVRSSGYLAYLGSGQKTETIPTVLNRNLGPDTVTISETARQKLAVAKGLAEPELNDMGKLMASRLDDILTASEEADEYTRRAQLLPGNYARLQAIEAEIQQGNDSQKLQDEKLLLILLGDVRELTDQDLAQGREMLDELMPSRSESLSFSDLVKALRKSAGMGGIETDGAEEADEAMSPETRLMAEKLKEFLQQSKGADISIALKGDWKETTVKTGPDKYGNQRINVSIDGEIAVDE